MSISISGDNLIVKRKDKLVFVPIERICFIERQNQKTYIHLDKEVIYSRSLLNELFVYLPPHFKRLHKSFIVNFKRIQELVPINDQIYEAKYRGGKVALVSKKLYLVTIEGF
ncbi:LytTR family DNA-binding domain-containing protein [Paenibacillus sp. PL91]|uniref:LytTR family DNA-binding domain-containing protein n=1 Tax=Paenibacillus sp. PL91 TaxID=2729538 RepID=UPI00145D0494|nr:LytTR family DNA-binding domain-containing protein [Paenibacillus sp. PL91]MBC9201350.1 LytTR family transcriptional regulator [Paenibacillus sp. PL91]